MTDILVHISVDRDPDDVVDYLGDCRIDARAFSDEAIAVPLDVERGDRVTAIKDGTIEVVQDAIPVSVTGGEIVAVHD